ncbi:MAG TPA: M20/M25/M40 family metallo-hydrolase [Candidatus Dormibacteraeota bacterium]|nr:M20/M25/M40 family metallo-hydrolase [Candidatus Dormibacteraeota bacterium]
MRTVKTLFVVCILNLASFAANPPAENTEADKVIQAALQPSPIQENLRRLTDEIGGRVPGTLAMQHAVQWGRQAFTEAGADSVHTEGFEVPNSWSEGATEMIATTAHQVSSTTVGGGTVLSTFRVRAVSVGWAPALAPVKHVPMVDVGEGTEADFKKAGDFTGKIVLVHTTVLKTWDDLFAEYANAPPIVDRAVKGKAKAVAFMATREHDILYRHTNAGAGEIDRLPMVIVAREDGERMARLLAAGNLVWADLSIPNQIGGPIKTSNVVAEIRGSEKPDEFVILGAHLDSWELGTGALDNGCNAALVIDALRAIKASGVTPRRTIRFILFSGEEEGLLGSRAYAVGHRAELDRAAGVIIFDSGVGKTTGFILGGRRDVSYAAKELIAPLAQFDVKELKMDMEWGSDHFDFMLEGVPTFMADQQEANYLENYHAVSDTYDKVDFAQLKKHVAEAAALSVELANLPQHIGARLTHDQIEQTMRDTKSIEMFKAFGLWDDWVSGKRGRQK